MKPFPGRRLLRLVMPRRLAMPLTLATLGLLMAGAGAGTSPARAQASAAPADIAFPSPPPKAPNPDDLVEYYTTSSTRNRYLLDLASVAAADAESVRFTVVIESSSGVRNVRHEALRCSSMERRLLAIARPDGSWSVTTNSRWQPLGQSDNHLGYDELQKAFCFGGVQSDRAVVEQRIRTGRRLPNY